jgi:GntR family transcriptional repressor for pyruvate dehydrogenase complex
VTTAPRVDAHPTAEDASPAAPVRHSTLNVRRTEKVSEVIAREIVRDSRGLPPGTMLPPEAKLLEQYQVGRASLREALRLLEVQGLIVIRTGPGGGPMIAEADSAHFGRMASLYFHLSGATNRDNLDARLILEPVVAGIIAQRQDPKAIAVLEAYLASSETSVSGSLPSSDAALTDDEKKALEFHIMLMTLSGNPIITLLARSLQDLPLQSAGAALHPETDVSHVHDMIARAITEGRPAQAEQLMREHMIDFIEYQLAHAPGYLDQTVSWR